MKVWEWGPLVKMPTTAVIITTGIVLSYLTAARYLLSGIHIHVGKFQAGFPAFNPDGEWLLFVAALLGVGTTSFGIKRYSDHELQRARQPHVKAQTAEVTADQVKVTQTSEG
jgi:hypothetical protein